MKNMVKINENYYYNPLKELTYEELKSLGEWGKVWCEYSHDWNCKVKDEIKIIERDFYFPNEIDLRGSIRCIGNLKNTMNRSEMTVKVYKLEKIIDYNLELRSERYVNKEYTIIKEDIRSKFLDIYDLISFIKHNHIDLATERFYYGEYILDINENLISSESELKSYIENYIEDVRIFENEEMRFYR